MFASILKQVENTFFVVVVFLGGIQYGYWGREAQRG
jgi:hypothetical protein